MRLFCSPDFHNFKYTWGVFSGFYICYNIDCSSQLFNHLVQGCSLSVTLLICACRCDLLARAPSLHVANLLSANDHMHTHVTSFRHPPPPPSHLLLMRFSEWLARFKERWVIGMCHWALWWQCARYSRRECTLNFKPRIKRPLHWPNSHLVKKVWNLWAFLDKTDRKKYPDTSLKTYLCSNELARLYSLGKVAISPLSDNSCPDRKSRIEDRKSPLSQKPLWTQICVSKFTSTSKIVFIFKQKVLRTSHLSYFRIIKKVCISTKTT